MFYICPDMKQRKNSKKTTSRFDALSLVHHPHDKYVRFVLQTRDVALQFIQFCLKQRIQEKIDFESLTLTEDSFIDANLQQHFADVCYSGKLKTDEPFRISIIFEHKSAKPDTPVIGQLLRYISNVWSMDVKQGRHLSCTIPILIYHGSAPLKKETPDVLFPNLSKDLVAYLPFFEYEIIDIKRISDERIEQLEFLLIRNILLALKHGRDEIYLQQNWQKIVIFAPQLRNQIMYVEIFRATILYINRISPTVNQKIKDMDSNPGTTTEFEAFKPYFMELFEKGMEQGIEKGMEKGIEKGMEKGQLTMLLAFIKKNPTWSDEQVAAMFDIEQVLVARARKQKK